MNQRLPNTLIVGVPKCGTSSMHTYFRDHPQVYVSEKKELHWFSRDRIAANLAGPGDREVFDRIAPTFDAYKAHFADARDEPVVLEASPSYAYFNDTVIPRLKDTLGSDLKIILQIRNPIKRAHSTWVHMVTNGRETLSFHDAILAEERRAAEGYGDFWRYAGHGFYAPQIEPFVANFGRENVKVIVLEDFNRDRKQGFLDLARWLGVDGSFLPKDLDIAYGHTGRAKNPALKATLDAATAAAVKLKRMIPKGLYDRARILNAKLGRMNTTRDVYPLEDRTWDQLAERFRTDLERTSALIGQDLTPWLDRPRGGHQ